MSELPAGPQPPFFEKLFSLMPAASVDRKPENSSFGDVLQQVYPLYRQVRRHRDMASCVSLRVQNSAHSAVSLCSQGDVVSVTFVAGNPRNSGDIVRPKTSLFSSSCSLLSFLSNLLHLFVHCREIKVLLLWRCMTTEQAPGRLSTPMHHGRPGRFVCYRCPLYVNAAKRFRYSCEHIRMGSAAGSTG